MLKPFTEVEEVERLPTTVFALDLLTGGGLPIGRYTLFWGDKSTGKSTLALRIIGSFLRRYKDKKALYCDFENTFDVRWAKNFLHDIEPERLMVANPAYAEEGIELLQEMTEKGDYNLIIIDSLAMMIPMKEAEADADSNFVGLIARTVNSLLRRITPAISRHNREGNPITVLLINQARSSINSYGGGVTKPGGKLQDAIASLEVKFYQGSLQKDKTNRPLRVIYNFVIEKNKVGGVPKTLGEYSMFLRPYKDYRPGMTHDPAAIVKYLQENGLIEKDKNKWILHDDEPKEFKTKAEIEKLFFDEHYKYDWVRKLLERGII